MKAIILAGQGREDTRRFGQTKSLVDFKGRPLIHYTIDALSKLAMIDYILVIGNKQALTPIIGNRVDEIIEEEKDILDNLMKSTWYFYQEKSVMTITSDIPLITPEAIEHFVIKAQSLKADFSYPIVERSVYEARYPGIKRTYLTLKEGAFTGGNLAIINPYKFQSLESHIRPLIEHRKNPLKMIRALGMSITTQLLLKQLTIKKLETYAKETFNIEARAIVSPYPEISSDIDKIEDIRALAKYT